MRGRGAAAVSTPVVFARGSRLWSAGRGGHLTSRASLLPTASRARSSRDPRAAAPVGAPPPRAQLATALRKAPYQTNVLLAGFEPKAGPSLYFMDTYSAMAEVNFGVHGHASSFLLSVFDRTWKVGAATRGRGGAAPRSTLLRRPSPGLLAARSSHRAIPSLHRLTLRPSRSSLLSLSGLLALPLPVSYARSGAANLRPRRRHSRA